jgi:hypothetical protein
MSRADYERVRSSRRIRPSGHADADVETVVERADDYRVVQKTGRRRSDRRTDGARS